MKKAIFISVLIITLLLFPPVAEAKRLLPRAQGTSTATSRSTSNTTTSVKFRKDRNAIIVAFSNLTNAHSIAYQFTYKSAGTTQGINGILTDMTIDPTSRELLFGTCSATVCRYDTNITDAKLTVTTTLKNGTRIVKPYALLR